MKTLLKVSALCLAITAGHTMATPSEEIMWGVATGAAARLTSYALRDQADLSNGQAIGGGVAMLAALTIARQANEQQAGANFPWSNAMIQATSGAVTYVLSMYIFPTKDKKEKEAANRPY